MSVKFDRMGSRGCGTCGGQPTAASGRASTQEVVGSRQNCQRTLFARRTASTVSGASAFFSRLGGACGPPPTGEQPIGEAALDEAAAGVGAMVLGMSCFGCLAAKRASTCGRWRERKCLEWGML